MAEERQRHDDERKRHLRRVKTNSCSALGVVLSTFFFTPVFSRDHDCCVMDMTQTSCSLLPLWLMTMLLIIVVVIIFQVNDCCYGIEWTRTVAQCSGFFESNFKTRMRPFSPHLIFFGVARLGLLFPNHPGLLCLVNSVILVYCTLLKTMICLVWCHLRHSANKNVSLRYSKE
jgi:hypothetical protein